MTPVATAFKPWCDESKMALAERLASVFTPLLVSRQQARKEQAS